MKKRTVKTAICALSLLVCLLVATVAMTACDKNTFVSDYASAQEKWYSADNKAVYDTLTIDGNLGSGEGAVPVTITLEGYRAYIGDEWEMNYTLSVDGLQDIAGALVGGVLATGVDLTLSRTTDGNITIGLNALGGLLNVSLPVAEFTIRDYIPVFDFADNVFYGAEKIRGSADSYTIAGADSIAYVLYQLAPVLSNNFGFDMLPMLEEWLTLGDVTGSVSFADGNFAAMTTSQDISVFAPNEDLDFLAYNIDNFPDMLISFSDTKTLAIEGIPVLGTLELDFSEAFTDGIGLSATITSSASYRFFGADATFESIAEDYDAAQATA